MLSVYKSEFQDHISVPKANNYKNVYI